jgi:colicin import membrane protein
LIRQYPRPFLYALLVHVLLLAILVFSLDWSPEVKPSVARKQAPVQAVAVDAERLDAELDRQKAIEEAKQREAARKLEEARKQAEQAEQKRRREEQRLQVLKREEEQKRKAAEAEKKRQADLALKKKAEEEKKRKEEEARRKAEAEKKRLAAEKRKAEEEKKRQEEERRKAEAEKKRLAEEKRKAEEARRKAEQEMQARLAAEQERLTAQRQSAMQRMIDEYVLYIREKVQRSWIRPTGSAAELSCTVEVRLIPSGEVIDAQIVRSSGSPAFDRSVEAAVFKASPLPVPPDPEVQERFRSLRFEFKPG